MAGVLQVAAGSEKRPTRANHDPIQSDHGVPIVVAGAVHLWRREIRQPTSEMMALPNNQLDTTYWLPVQQHDLDTQLRVALILLERPSTAGPRPVRP